VINRRGVKLFIALVALAGCGPDEAKTDSYLVAQQREVDRITNLCGLPRNVLSLKGDGSLRLRPAETESYQRIRCALDEVRDSEFLPDLPIGFVGSESYDENMQ
jgi:hypothetical protein